MANDHQLRKLWLLNKFSLLIPEELHREKYREYRYCCLAVERFKFLSMQNDQTHSSINNKSESISCTPLLSMR